MMRVLTNNDKITVPQTVALIVTTILGTGILSLPHEVAKAVGSDGWILVLLGGITTLIISFIIGSLVMRFPQDTFIEYSRKTVGKFLSYPLSALLAIHYVLITSLSLRIFAEVMNVFMLPRTPMEFIILTQMLTSLYLVRYGVEPVARLSEILLPILIIPIFAMYVIAFPKADFSELLPFMATPLIKMAKGIFFTLFSFLGFEILLVVAPYMRSPKRIYWSLFASIGIVTLIYFFIVVVVFATMGVENTKMLMWPSMSIIRTLTAPGGIFDRMDALAMALWTIAAFTTLNSFYFAAVLAFAHIAGFKEFKPLTSLLFPWIYLVAVLPPGTLSVIKWANLMGFLGVLVSVVVPGLILLLSSQKKGKSHDSKS